jgi:hypothetical protein
MRELGPVKEPEDEKQPKKKSPKTGFLASWLRNRETGEGDAKLDESDLVDPEKDALFNDGFSKRWHKLFSGLPIDDTTLTTAATSDDSSTDLLLDNARQEINKSAHSTSELKKVVGEQQGADSLTDKEVTAQVPVSHPSSPKADPLDDAMEYEDLSEPKKPKGLAGKSRKTDTMSPSELESLASTEPADAKTTPTEDFIPRVDPSEYAHQHDTEDNVDAPGAPTKGYRGLLVVDHSEDEQKSAPKAQQPELVLPSVIRATEPEKTSHHPSSPTLQTNQTQISYSGNTYSSPRLDRHVQALIDRPASAEVTSLIDTISEMNRRQSDIEQNYLKTSQNSVPKPPPPITLESTSSIPPIKPANIEKPSGAVSVGNILDSRRGSVETTALEASNPASNTPEINTTTPIIDSTIQDELDKHPSFEPKPTIPTPSVGPMPLSPPPPLYTPPAARPTPASPMITNIPIIEPTRYQLAMRRGIISGLALSGAVLLGYLFG